MGNALKLQLAIIDDDAASREYTCALVNKWNEIQKHDVKITHFSSAQAFLFEYDKKCVFDILLLDIEMPGINGVELAKHIRASEKNGQQTQIIFITGYPEFISSGYDVSALHYLMKPLNEAKFFEVMCRAAEKSRETARKLVFRSDGEYRAVYMTSIIYAEAISHYLKISTDDGDFQIRMKFSELAEMLGADFVQTHRSYIVNLKHILSITKTELVLDSGMRIPISRSEQPKVHSAFVNYFKGDEA